MLSPDLHKNVNSNSSHRHLVLLFTRVRGQLPLFTLPAFRTSVLPPGFTSLHSAQFWEKLSHALCWFAKSPICSSELKLLL